MQHWSRPATRNSRARALGLFWTAAAITRLVVRNWRASKFRIVGAVLAVALGTADVVWVTCCYESVRQSVLSWAGRYVGNAHITVTSMWGKYDQIPQRVARAVQEIENVELVAPRLLQRRDARAVTRRALDERPEETLRWAGPRVAVDLHGIDVDSEPVMRAHPLGMGRMLTSADGFACVLEEKFAREQQVGVGDFLLVWDPSAQKPYQLEIVGLFERRRIARFQKPLALVRLEILQRVTLKFALVSTIDVKLRHVDRERVRRTSGLIRARIKPIASNARVRSAEARMKQIDVAQSNQRLVLVILGCVAMLTALVIILSTLSMGLLERVRQLGLLRCVGMTRMQLAALVLAEVIPLGALGVLGGVPIGLGLTALSVWLVPDYVGSFLISWNGIALACAAGMITTFVAALLPALATARISPLETAHPRAARPRPLFALIAFTLAALTLAWQHLGIVQHTVRDVNFVTMAALAVILLYLGYALLAPLVVHLIGSAAVVLAAGALRVRTRLLHDQIGHAVWRSAGICCGLMVGLSLVVGIVVVNESVRRGWQFPKQFPAAYLWTFDWMPPDAAERITGVPGVGTFSVANSINVIVEERPLFAEKLLLSVTWFLGVDPDSFFDLVKLEFLEGEGDQRSARALLAEGGHILIADDFSRSRNKHLGDQVRVYDERRGRWLSFTVAGVVRSPALDIAAHWFQMQSEYNVVAAGSVLGTNADLKRLFGVDSCNLVLLNFDLADVPVPPDWPPPRAGIAASPLPEVYYDTTVARERRWRRWRQEQVLREVRHRLGAAQVFSGTVAELKDEIDRELSHGTLLLTAIPGVALLVAAIGVANLMAANVTARAKQLAILRAVGATRGLILRMVIGEALVLGLLGCALGLALGLHLSANITELVNRMWGFRVALTLPWFYVGMTALLTVGLCIVAGILPARHASRTNVVDALHVT